MRHIFRPYKAHGPKQPKPAPPESFGIIEKSLVSLLPADALAAWLAELTLRYEASANNSIKRLVEYYEEQIKYEKENRRPSVWDRKMVPSTRYVIVAPLPNNGYEGSYSSKEYNTKMLEKYKSNRCTIDLPLARRDAKDQLDSAVNIFAYRGATKLVDHGFIDSTGLKMTGTVRYTGYLEAEFDISNATLAVHMTCKSVVNYRYGENSANGDLTVYNQYPFKVKDKN